MKKLIFTISLAIIAFYSNGQSLNDQLYRAVSAKDTSQVKELLGKGADANYKPKMGQAEMVLLSAAINKGDANIVRILVAHKANVNARDWFNTTPLMYAANKGDLAIMKLLIANGADVKAADGQGNTVLTAAKESGKPDVIKFIDEQLKQ